MGKTISTVSDIRYVNELRCNSNGWTSSSNKWYQIKDQKKYTNIKDQPQNHKIIRKKAQLERERIRRPKLQTTIKSEEANNNYTHPNKYYEIKDKAKQWW